MYRVLSAPLSVQIEVTELCNNRCFHCYNYWLEAKTGRKHHTLSVTQVEYIITCLANAGVFDVTFTGGEPTLFFDVLLAGLKKAKGLGLACGLNSNLTKLDSKQARLLHRNGIAGILVSLAGPNAEIHDKIVNRRGAFEEVVRGIKIVRSEGMRVSANMVVTTLNQDYVLATGRFAHSIGCTTFGATRATAPGNCPNFNELYKVGREAIKQHLQKLLQLREETGIIIDVFEHYPHCLIGDLETFQYIARRRCSAGVTAATIGADGSIRPCSHVPWSYGNIFHEGLEKAWQSMGEWRDGTLLPEECRSCKHLSKCGGGCRMAAKSHSDNIAGMDPDASSEAGVIPSTKKWETVELPPVIRVNPTARFRDEEWGGCAKITDGGVTFLSPDGYKLVQALAKWDSFTLEELAREFPDFDPEAGVDFFRRIFKRRLVIEAK